MLDRGTDSPHDTDSSHDTNSPRVDTCTADCCASQSRISQHFDGRIAELTTDTDFPEMVDVSAMLLDLVEGDVAGAAPTVLELGCGSGGLLVALLKRGASTCPRHRSIPGHAGRRGQTRGAGIRCRPRRI